MVTKQKYHGTLVALKVHKYVHGGIRAFLVSNLRTQVPLYVRFVTSDYQCDSQSRLSGD
jgi:hypothetical protein